MKMGIRSRLEPIRKNGRTHAEFPHYQGRRSPLKADNRKLCLGGLHSKWVDAKGDKKYKLAAKYAKQIRDLPLNPMYNFKDAE